MSELVNSTKKSLLNFTELLLATQGTVLNEKTDCFFTSVQTDSRNVGKNTLFVPLIGEFQNGHKYINCAIENGASVIFINEDEFNLKKDEYIKKAKLNNSVLFVIVKNTLYALQNIAEKYVEKKCQNMIKVSITGSSGKTTTKEMLVSVCKVHFGEENVAYTKGNFNSETGLPLSVFSIKGIEKICIFEMGMNRENEIAEISKVLKSQYGIITNIGTAHIGLLGSQKNIANEKRKSLSYIPKNGAAFLCSEDDFTDFCSENVKGKIIKFGKNVPSEQSGIKFIKNNSVFGSVFEVDGLVVNFPLAGEYNFTNATSVIACARELGISSEEIKIGLEKMNSISGRMEVKQFDFADKKVQIIKDYYNANLDSMSKVINFCDSQKNIKNQIFVLGEMKELGTESENSHKKIGEYVNNSVCNCVYFIGSQMNFAYSQISDKKEKIFFENPSDENFKQISTFILNKIKKSQEKEILVLLKGSHSMNLERLCEILEGDLQK